MSSENETRDNPALEALQARVRQLHAEMHLESSHASRRQRITIIAGVILISISLGALKRASNLARKLDPATVAEIGRAEVETQLPDSRQMVGDYLTEQSPTIVAGVIDSLMEGIPGLRAGIEDQLRQQMETTALEFQNELIMELSDHLDEQHRQIEGTNPGASDAEKLRALTTVMCSNFSEVFQIAIGEIYPGFTTQLGQVDTYLADLSSEKPVLTARQRMEAEIVEILLCLMLEQKPAGP